MRTVQVTVWQNAPYQETSYPTTMTCILRRIQRQKGYLLLTRVMKNSTLPNFSGIWRRVTGGVHLPVPWRTQKKPKNLSCCSWAAPNPSMMQRANLVSPLNLLPMPEDAERRVKWAGDIGDHLVGQKPCCSLTIHVINCSPSICWLMSIQHTYNICTSVIFCLSILSADKPLKPIYPKWNAGL